MNTFLDKDELLSILDGIKKIKVCFVGDVAIDAYWRADMKKSTLSRETPHYILPVVSETYSPGGGGNVVSNIASLEPQKLIPVTAIADDWRGKILTDLFEAQGVDLSGIVKRKDGVTTCYVKPIKVGISGIGQEDPRLDFENYEEIDPRDEEKLLAALEIAAKEADVIAVSDYCTYGVITQRMRDRLCELAKTMPVIVDSRDRIDRFNNVIIKPNEVEAARAVGADFAALSGSVQDYINIGNRLESRTGAPAIITLGALGGLWCENGECHYIETVPADGEIDIVGAGDTFLSAFSCAYAVCKDGVKAMAFANLASGVTVKKIGTTGTASPDEIIAKWEKCKKNDNFEILQPSRIPNGKVKAAVFDFDGTISTLRCGWERVMRGLMLDFLSDGTKERENEIDAYIDSSTGIQTVYQMKWLKEQADKIGRGDMSHDVWWYKDEYNRRLMEEVGARTERLKRGEDSPNKYLISGVVDFIKALKDAGIELYLASGTDHEDVLLEAEALGVSDCFGIIKGAPRRAEACSKEAVIKMLLEESGLSSDSLLLVGDGKVEIALGEEKGCFTLGVASDEVKLSGVNPVKRKRLINAGADVIIGDFTERDALMRWLGL
ncbi:MAG: HAD hydrolase-like protein [Clostridia bacterium]|nr:HAD hydrolase-like protein [Clostridia bacterium]